MIVIIMQINTKKINLFALLRHTVLITLRNEHATT
jgi:hypothetical protein